MESLKKAVRNYWVLSAFCIVMGGALIYRPGFFTRMVGIVVGGLMALYGAASLVRYFVGHKADPERASGLVSGVIFMAAGIFVMVRPDFIPKVISLVFGCYMLVSGVVNVQEALYVKGRGEPNWLRAFLSALLTALLGISLLVNPLLIVNGAMTILGICLLVAGIMNLTGRISISRSVFRRKKEDNNGGSAEFIDID